MWLDLAFDTQAWDLEKIVKLCDLGLLSDARVALNGTEYEVCCSVSGCWPSRWDGVGRNMQRS